MTTKSRGVVAVVVAVIAITGIIFGSAKANDVWTSHGCFTVTYVDLRGGGAPDPMIYTTAGKFGGSNGVATLGEWVPGDYACTTVFHNSGGDWVSDPPQSTINARHHTGGYVGDARP